MTRVHAGVSVATLAGKGERESPGGTVNVDAMLPTRAESRGRGGIGHSMMCCQALPLPLATPLPACGCRQVKVNLSSCQVTRKYLSASLSRISTGKSVERSNRRGGRGGAKRPVCPKVRVCRCASVVQQAGRDTKTDEAKSQPMSKKQQTNTHTLAHAQDVSVSWTHKATL